MAQVVAKNLTRTFKGPKGIEIRAVNDLNLTLDSGELLVLVGPSGCGKTTTLRLIAGLDEPTAGNITIDGKVMNSVAPKDRDVAMVFQNHALYPHMTVRENLAFGLKLRHFSSADIARRVGEAAEILGLNDCLDRKPAELSGGQHQRVALGRAMVRKPKVFLLDEPLSNLDVPTRAQLRRELAKMHRELAATMIYVTHDQVEAMMLGQRIAVMKDGVLQQTAQSTEIYRKPANQFVAGFIGSPPMNFFRGTLAQSNGTLTFHTEGSSGLALELDKELVAKLANQSGKPVVMGIRPEDVAEKTAAMNATENIAAEVVVELLETVGAESYLYAAAGTHSLVARVGADFQAQPRQKMALRFDMRRAHFFDPVTGARIG